MRLTKNGCIQMLKDRICFQQRRLSEGWSCVIVFDIPEDAKTLRASFRRFLKQAGFHPLQLSVWITDKDVVKDLSCLVKRLDIERWVQLFVGIKQ
jgi:DNA-binding transcriptional regulator PaaX